MKIMHIAQAPGGVSRYLEMFLRNVDTKRYENVLVCSQDYDKSDFSALANNVETIEMERSIGVKDVFSIFRIAKLIWKYRPDIIYCHSSKAGALGRIASCVAPGRVIYNAHGWAFNMKVGRKTRRFYQMVEWLLHPIAKKIVCISNFEQESALRHHIAKRKRLKVIFNGVEIDKIRNVVRNSTISKQSLNIPEDALVIGMVGRITEQKAPDVFVQMAEKIVCRKPNAHFVIVGDGPQEDEIRQLLFEKDLQDRFHITGWVENPYEYMALFDVGVLLSRWEGFGLALCEYMAAGIPLVSTKTDAVPDLVKDGVNGLLVYMDDYETAAECVLRILNDSRLREYLIANASKIVEEKFDIRRVVMEHELLFDEVMSL